MAHCEACNCAESNGKEDCKGLSCTCFICLCNIPGIDYETEEINESTEGDVPSSESSGEQPV